METKNFSYMYCGRKPKIDLFCSLHMKNLKWLFFVIIILNSCAGSVKHQTNSPSETSPNFDGVPIQDTKVDTSTISTEPYGPQEVYGPQAPADLPAGATPPPVIEIPTVPVPLGNMDPSKESPKLCVILGPGMAKAIAHAAVLEAIKKANMPVHCVVGSEMGGIVAALFSFYGGNPNNLQWQLFKFNKDNYFHFPMLSLREPKSNGKHLNEFLRGIFHNKKMEELPIKFGTVATEPSSGSAVFIEQGDLVDALSATAAMPGIFEPWDLNGTALVSGAISSPAPVDLAKKLGGNFFVFVDVAEDSAGAAKNMDRFQRSFVPVKSLVRFQKKEASFVIQVRTGALPFEDFNRQGDYLAAGARAAEANIIALKAAWEKFVATK